jgi:hypothetical protein
MRGEGREVVAIDAGCDSGRDNVVVIVKGGLLPQIS